MLVKLQQIILITAVAILVAAKYFSLPRWPINPVSTRPTNGIAKFAKKMGIDSFTMYNFEIFTGCFMFSNIAITYFLT